MFLDFLLLVTITSLVAVDEPIWIGTEAVRTVEIDDPNLTPRKVSESLDRNSVNPLVVTAVDPVTEDGPAKTSVYVIRYIGLKAGKHDLRDYLQFSQNVNRQMVPPILVSIADPLPTTHHGQLETPPVLVREPRSSGISRGMVAMIAGAWGGVLASVGVVFWRRSYPRKVGVPVGTPEDVLPTKLRLAERKRLTPQGVAAIERELLERWRQELGLEGCGGVALIRALEDDARGKDLLAALEAWRLRLESGPTPLPAVLKEWVERSTKPPTCADKASP